MIDTVDALRAELQAQRARRQALSPLDLEREFGLVGGDIFHGSLAWTSCSARARCWARATTAAPLPGLYLCGSGTHPGGGVTGLPGRNAAREILRDLGRGPRPELEDAARRDRRFA